MISAVEITARFWLEVISRLKHTLKRIEKTHAMFCTEENIAKIGLKTTALTHPFTVTIVVHWLEQCDCHEVGSTVAVVCGAVSRSRRSPSAKIPQRCVSHSPVHSDGWVAQRPVVLNISLYCLYDIIFWPLPVDPDFGWHEFVRLTKALLYFTFDDEGDEVNDRSLDSGMIKGCVMREVTIFLTCMNVCMNECILTLNVVVWKMRY